MDWTVYSEPKQRHMWNDTHLHLLLQLAGHRSMWLHSFCSSIYITHDMEQKTEKKKIIHSRRINSGKQKSEKKSTLIPSSQTMS